ncbi:MAG: xanthine dehydrogenase family protein subunit M [bacterium]|nr:xanthine dehydrogenase family protein subunit M [bacterium]
MAFHYVAVNSVDETLAAIQAHGDAGKVYAGGVALSILMKSKIFEPENLIDIYGVAELSFIEGTKNGGVRIGARTVHRDIETSPLIRERFPLLSEVFHNVATIRIRNAGTIGGNLCFAEPASDPPAALLVLEARMKAKKADGSERVIPAGEFWTDYYECALAPDELLTEIEIDPLPQGFRTAYTRFTTRSKEDKPCISISVAVSLEADGKTCREARIGLGGVEAVFRRVTAAEAGLKGKELTREAIDGVLARSLDDLEPLTDIRASDAYRRQVTPVFIRRTIEKALGS